MQKKILIAEDDQAILEVLKSILEGEGHLVFSPRNERAIYDIVRQESPDLILLDIWLMGHDGGKIAKDLKGKEETRSIPVIMMSANNETEKISREVGADGFLLKPFTIEDLQAVIVKHTK